MLRALVLSGSVFCAVMLASGAARADEAPDAKRSFGVEAVWKPGLVLVGGEGRFALKPIGIAQPLLSLRVEPGADDELAGTGFRLRRGAIGFDARLFDLARVFFCGNVGRGRFELWDYFVDLDPWDGVAVLRAGRFRPWLGRQRWVAAHKFQMVELARGMTGVLEIDRKSVV